MSIHQADMFSSHDVTLSCENVTKVMLIVGIKQDFPLGPEVHNILQPRHIFIRVKAFILMLFPVGLKLLIISMCFAWCLVKSINVVYYVTAHGHMNCHINIAFFFIDIPLLIS